MCTPAVDAEDEPVFEGCDTFSKLQRVLAQLVKFTRLLRMTKNERSNSVQDIQTATKYIVRVLRNNELSEEI